MSDDYSDNTSTTGSLSPGGQSTGKLEASLDADWFRISLTEGKYYTFELASTTPTYYARLGVFNSLGQSLASNYLAGTSTKVTLKAPATGTFYVAASDQSYSSFAPLSYTVKASAGATDEIGDSRNVAHALTVGQKVSSTIESNNDIDYFKMVAVAGVTYSVSAAWTGMSGYGNVRIEDADGAPVYTNSSSSPSFTATRTGAYYIAIGNYNGASTPYDLTVNMATDDFMANASGAGQLGTGGTSVGGMINVGGDKDWFATTLAANTTYWFTVGQGTDGNGQFYGSAQVRLLDADGNVAATYTGYNYIDSSNGVLLQYVPAKAGTYYLEVGGDAYSTGKYAVRAVVGESDDYGDTTAAATALAVGSTINGKLAIPQDKDTFKFTATAGKTYLVELTGKDAANNPALDLGVASDGYYYDRVVEYTKPGVTEYRVITPSTTGDFLLTVYNSSSRGTTGYTLKVYEPAQDDYADGTATKGVLAVGGKATGTLDYTGDADTFKVTLQNGAKYAFQLRGAESGNGTLQLGGNVVMQLTGADGSPYATPLTSNGDGTYTFTSASEGDYYLSVRGANYGNPVPDAVGSYAVYAVALTGDTSAPTLVSYTPHVNAGMADNITLRFSENIMRGSYNDVITLRDNLGVTVESYYSGDQRITISGDTLTINPTALLRPGSTYLLSVPGASVVDLAGNKYAGGDLLSIATVGTVSAGTAGNDYLVGLGTGVKVSGGGGLDTVIYGYTRSSYDVARLPGSTTVTSRSYDNSTKQGDTLDGVERLMFSDVSVALDVDGVAGQAYRLYKAAFDRAPDKAGIGYWMAQMDKGLPLAAVAQGFLNSAEFTTLYGAAPNNEAFTTKLYTNILHRAPDQAGVDYWVDVLNKGANRANVLVAFSEGVENVDAVATLIGNGFEYTPYG